MYNADDFRRLTNKNLDIAEGSPIQVILYDCNCLQSQHIYAEICHRLGRALLLLACFSFCKQLHGNSLYNGLSQGSGGLYTPPIPPFSLPDALENPFLAGWCVCMCVWRGNTWLYGVGVNACRTTPITGLDCKQLKMHIFGEIFLYWPRAQTDYTTSNPPSLSQPSGHVYRSAKCASCSRKWFCLLATFYSKLKMQGSSKQLVDYGQLVALQADI